MSLLLKHFLKTPFRALTGVDQLFGCHPPKQKFRFPGMAHAWVAGGWVLWLGCVMMFLSHIDVSLPLFLLPFPSL